MATFVELESREHPRTRGRLTTSAHSFLFGCELSASTTAFTFKVEDDDETLHTLALQMVCLGEGVKDECNVVEAVALNHHKEIAVPIASLKLSCQSMVNLEGFELQPPVSFRLKSGSGPVYVTGHHQIVYCDREEESDYEDEEVITPIKPAKKKQGKN
ncbi:nucleoplasmin-3 [Rhinatrema bivittatum]|uniref:nucleoplasmin-3 n=1 Tax=Rhinatrema bivittatum TaxID=194408 RepID=UPI00112C32C2|nr:nucleoplasmin-3 [Rhinatrema bivittatum]